MEEMFYIKSPRNKKIACVLHNPINYNNKLILICHGFRSSKTGAHNMFTKIARKLCKKGYKVLRFDLPCNGDSEGDFKNNDFSEWTENLIAFTNSKKIKFKKIGLLGNSMGGACVINSLHHGAKANSFVTWVPGITFPKTNSKNTSLVSIRGIKYMEEKGVRVKWKFWQNIFKIDFQEEIANLRLPGLMIFVKNDKYVPYGNIQKMLKSFPKEIKVRTYENVDHSFSDYVKSEELINQTIAFFDKTL